MLTAFFHINLQKQMCKGLGVQNASFVVNIKSHKQIKRKKSNKNQLKINHEQSKIIYFALFMIKYVSMDLINGPYQ